MRTSLADGESILDLLHPVTITRPDTQEENFGKEKTITAAENFPAVKTLKVAVCNEIRPELLKAWNRRVLWLTRVCQVP